MTNQKREREVFYSWLEIHDADIDKYEYSDNEWAFECFLAGVEFGRLPHPSDFGSLAGQAKADARAAAIKFFETQSDGTTRGGGYPVRELTRLMMLFWERGCHDVQSEQSTTVEVDA